MHSKEDAESGQMTDTARAAAGGVAAEAKDQARSLTDQARGEAEQLTGDLRSRLQEEAQSQAQRASKNLRQWSQELDSMAEQGETQSPVPDVVHQVAQGGRGAADFLDDRGVNGLVEEVKDFASRNPMAFLTGAVVAGFTLGRILKVSSGATEQAGAEGGDASWTDESSQAAVPGQSTPIAGETVPPSEDTQRRYRSLGGEGG